MSSYAVAEAFGVKDQVVIVTGAAGHIGQGIAEAFATNGAITILSDRPTEQLEKVAAALEARGLRVAAIPANLVVESDLRKLVDLTVARFGRIDALINCGGIPNSGPLGDEPAESFDRLYQTNVRSAWLLCKYAAEVMPPTGGSIVNIASINGYRAMFFCSLYAGTKSAVMATTRALATELASRRIRVNSISPGSIPHHRRNWERLLERIAEPYRSQLDQEFGALITTSVESRAQPLPIEGTPFDIAMGCIYLCSPAGGFITGADLVIDGGRLQEIPDAEPRYHERARSPWALVRERVRNFPDNAWISERPVWLRFGKPKPKTSITA